MTYEELLDNCRSQKVFEYGRSVIQIMEMKTYSDARTIKTDFIFHTDRNRQGVITIEHGDDTVDNPAALGKKRKTLEKDILDAVTVLVKRFRKATGSAPKKINIHISDVPSDKAGLTDYVMDSCAVDLDIRHLVATATDL